MKKETMLTYLDKQLNEKMAEYNVALDWDVKNHSIEVIFRLFAENKKNEQIDDADGTLSQEDVIEFEDGILFYNPEKTKLDPEYYLTTIAYEGKKGIKQSILDGFVLYLKEVLDEGQSELLDFLEDDTQEVFELTWSQEQFDENIENSKRSKEDTYITYPAY